MKKSLDFKKPDLITKFISFEEEGDFMIVKPLTREQIEGVDGEYCPLDDAPERISSLGISSDLVSIACKNLFKGKTIFLNIFSNSVYIDGKWRHGPKLGSNFDPNPKLEYDYILTRNRKTGAFNKRKKK